jgi:hypothetical protein
MIRSPFCTSSIKFRFLPLQVHAIARAGKLSSAGVAPARFPWSATELATAYEPMLRFPQGRGVPIQKRKKERRWQARKKRKKAKEPVRLEPPQLREFLRESFKSSVEAFKKIDQIIETLLGDIYGRSPESFNKLLESHGIKPDEYEKLPPLKRLEAARKLYKDQPNGMDTQKAYLNLIFAARYNWPEGTVDNMTMEEILEALQHALEADEWRPSKRKQKSIWAITQ